MPRWIEGRGWEDGRDHYLFTDQDVWLAVAVGIVIGALLCAAGVLIGVKL